MEFEKKDDGRTLVVRLFGDLDSMNTPELEQRIKREIEGVTDLTLDLAGLDYISSAGLRVFLTLTKRMHRQGEMRIINTGSEVMEIFMVTGFEKLLNIV